MPEPDDSPTPAEEARIREQAKVDRVMREAARAVDCDHDWVHLRVVPFVNMRGSWGDEFYCRRCLAKKKVAR